MPELRIVSLIASATEIVTAVGLHEYLVGRSHECDYPSSVMALPACSSSEVEKYATSNEIDQQVRSMVQDALSVYQVDYALLNDLSPTHILTQTQCEVCAVTFSEVERAIKHLSSKPSVTALEPVTLSDIWCDIQTVADIGNASIRGHTLVAQLQDRLATLSKLVASRETTPTVACIEWIDPLMYAANWVPELIAIAGGRPTHAQPGTHSDYFDFVELAQCDPDYILIMPCGFDIERSRNELEPLTKNPLWATLSAVRNHHVFLINGNHYFNRPGPRVVESAEIAAEILHSELCNFDHKCKTYTPLTQM